MALRRKATFQPYDMDTAIGTNNSGVLMFGYSLEDTDTVSSIISGGDEGGTDAPVFNAQDSVLWNNLRDAFRGEITQMYQQLRTSGAWSAQELIQRAEEHQGKWCEAIFNEDEYFKHLIPLIDPVTVDEHGNLIRTDRYLTMLQGSKEEQRKWWLTNRFRYMDSKYMTGDAVNSVISMRVFNSGTLTIKAAIDLYLAVRFGGGTTPILQRRDANAPANFTYTAQTGVTEMETWIYSADLITDVGDLSVFYGNEFDFSRATRLQRLKIGDGASTYSNANLKALDVRNSALLEYIDVRNCPNLAITVNLEGSPRLKEAYFDGTAITGCDLADGASVQKLHLPGTITTLTLINLNKLIEFVCPDFSHVSRLMLSNMDVGVINPITILNAIPANSQVNIQGLHLNLADATAIDEFYDLLDTMRGVSREKNASGEWMYHDYDKAQVSGTIYTSNITGAEIAEFNARYPYIAIDAVSTTSYLTYKSWDGETTLATVLCVNGVPQESSPSAPVRPAAAQYSYEFAGWNLRMDAETNDASAITDVYADRTVYAAYSRTAQTFSVMWTSNTGGGTTTLEIDSDVPYGSMPHYDGATPTYSDWTFTGWNPEPSPVVSDITYTTKWERKYDVKFYNGSTLLQSSRVAAYNDAVYTEPYPVTDDTALDFAGWSLTQNASSPDANALKNITGDTNIYAVFGTAVAENVEITDSWDTIIANIASGNHRYKIGNYKPLDLGTEGIVNMQIVGLSKDALASGDGKAATTWISKELLTTKHRMNPGRTGSSGAYTEGTGTIGGWGMCEMRTYCRNTIKPLIPSNVRSAIKDVIKYSRKYNPDVTIINDAQTTDDVWIPSAREIYGAVTNVETSGSIYAGAFPDNASRIKKQVGTSETLWWWTRSAYSTEYYTDVQTGGASSTAIATRDGNVPIGFCI